MLLLNAFSLNMLKTELARPVTVEARKLTLREAKQALGEEVESAVGHADTARVFSDVLGVEVPCNRTTVSLERGDVAVVGQYRGPRLQEGATSLPEGATIEWLLVKVK